MEYHENIVNSRWLQRVLCTKKLQIFYNHLSYLQHECGLADH